jgi:hypothetical protein
MVTPVLMLDSTSMSIAKTRIELDGISVAVLVALDI